MASDIPRSWNDSIQSRRIWTKPKLTPQQRAEITQRLADGDNALDLAVEYGVTASTIRQLR
ncbi:hypothetical protein [Streptomyces misionensis]|uniref:hypothetical protein n=1 Tax=Streptomyces misionensis TaxID=67331 RepID=UPI0036A6AC8D